MFFLFYFQERTLEVYYKANKTKTLLKGNNVTVYILYILEHKTYRNNDGKELLTRIPIAAILTWNVKISQL